MRLAILIFLLSGTIVRAQLDTNFTFAEPIDSERVDTLSLWATQYYVHQCENGSGAVPFLTMEGDSLGFFVDTCDFCSACLEGTAFVRDTGGNSTVLNYAGRANDALYNCRRCPRYAPSGLAVESWGSVRWRISDGYGDGVRDYRLIPFRTIAVDPTNIPYGSIVYIPSARDVEIVLPDGRTMVHDGYFFAGDTGGAIRQNHIDVFTGVYEGNPFPEVVMNSASRVFEAFLITSDSVTVHMRTLHER